VLALAGPLPAGDWPQFRGPGGTAVSDDTGLPLHWGPKQNVRWKADLPGRGLSSPVVAGGRLYVTCCSGHLQERLHVLCFDIATGKKRWERQFWATGNTMCNPKTCMAAPTPVTDRKRVYALFATGDLVALDAEGGLLWYRALARDYPQITNQVGMAASPVLWRDVLMLPMENAGDSFAAGLDARTGRNRWKVQRPRDINWVTPTLLERDGRTEVVFVSGQGMAAYDPGSGEQRWSYVGAGLGSIPTPAVGDGLMLLPGGAAVRPGSGDKPPAVAWKSNKLRPAYSSPLYYRGRVYALNNTSTVLACADMRTGRVLWQERLRGPFSASPVAAEGRIYLVNEEGLTTVLLAGDRAKVLATNALDASILATPALADGAVFLRSDRAVYCLARVALGCSGTR
jgi:outer membrane protein assembly factor BamB